MITLECSTDGQPCEYAEQIKAYVGSQFAMSYGGDCDRLEQIYNEILGSKNVRYGPIPKPESLVKIREVITGHIENTTPIQFFIPWGSEKPDGSGIDIADLSALKQLKALSERVSAYHTPGISVSIGIEDLTALHLFSERKEQAWNEARLYSDGLVDLIRILRLDFIHPILESELSTEQELLANIEPFESRMFDYLIWTETFGLGSQQAQPAFDFLVSNGWKGRIEVETRKHYLDLYARIYPDLTPEQRIKKLAAYFSESWARYHMGIRGLPSEPHIKLALHHPVPGVDPGPTVHYRTITRDHTALHMPPWRGKGYLVICDGEATAKISSFNSDTEYIKASLTISNEIGSVSLQTDYVLEE